ncbi:hypothetical protein [Streptomyces sp. RG80]|uniref:hypothetical protein n=1 Tax=Streptomyces sp. RG80 TaxID=3157340 RepID=UPI00338F6A66
MSNETKPNVRVRVHGRDYAAQVANDQVHKVLSEATAQAVQDLICEAVEVGLDLAHKAHSGDQDIREWLEPIRALAAEDRSPSMTPTIRDFIARYLA